MRSNLLWRSFILGLSVSLAAVPLDVPASTIAYTGELLPGGFDLDRLTFIDPPETIGRLYLFPVTGAFVGDDFSKEYMIDYAVSGLHAVDVQTGQATLIGDVDTSGNQATGMHWDFTSDQMFLAATDPSCATSTLYTLDVVDASTVEIGPTPGCIIGLAIDAAGHAFGIDQSTDSLVSIDTTTGDATLIGPLGMHPRFLITGFDFDPSNGLLHLFAYDDNSGTSGDYLVDTATGGATLVAPYDRPFFGLAFAELSDSIMSNGFDP